MQEKSRVAFVALPTGAVGIAFAPIFVHISEVGPSATAFYRVFLGCHLATLLATVQPSGY